MAISDDLRASSERVRLAYEAHTRKVLREWAAEIDAKMYGQMIICAEDAIAKEKTKRWVESTKTLNESK